MSIIKGSSRKGNEISGVSSAGAAQSKARAKNPIDADYGDVDLP